MARHRRPPIARRPGFEPLEGRALLATLTVTNANDSGAGSLRQAILDADAATGASTIGFAIPGPGLHTISPASTLPTISASVMIDGTTEPGYAGTPVIALDGAAAPGGLGLYFASNSGGGGVKGLAIDRFTSYLDSQSAIEVQSDSATIEDNFIGVDPAGSLASGNDRGIEVVYGTAGVVISGNVIGENNVGIALVAARSAAISNNFIGTDRAGRAVLGNGDYGIVVGAGTTASTASGNTIARNGKGAIQDFSNGGLTLSGNTISDAVSPLNLGVSTSSTPIIAAIGQSFTRTYTVTNNGSGAAEASLTLQARNQNLNFKGFARFSSVVAFTGAGTRVSQGSPAIDMFSTAAVATFGTIQPGQSATFTVAGSIIGAGPDFIDATFSGPSDPSLTATVQAPAGVVATTSVSGIGQADRTVVAQAPASARAGVPVTFTFAVADTSGELYPADTLFALQFTTTAGGPVQTGVATSTGSVMALPAFANGYGGDLGLILDGQVATVTATIIPPATGTVTASLFAYSPYEVDTAPANNLAFAAAAITPRSAPTALGATLLPKAGAASAVAIYFDAPLNPSGATNARNYALTSGGAAVPIRSATYDAASHVVTLRLARSLARPTAARLIVDGAGAPGLAGPSGAKLANPGAGFSLS